jgi:glyoxylase-like metal-dependent hydrolase (beta-lactamase superfamily II)
MKRTIVSTIICLLIFHAAALAADSDFTTYRLGSMKITRIEDSARGIPADLLIGQYGKIKEILPDGHCPNGIAAFVLDIGKEIILIDTGFGDIEDGSALVNLEKAGYAPGKITKLVLTHLHGDHVGGTIQGGKAVYKNADVYVSESELAFWSDKKNNFDKITPFLSNTFDIVADFKKLYNSRIKTFKEGEVFINWLKPISVPGHTEGHTMFVVEYEDRKLFIWADIMHCLKAQAQDPSISIIFDTDPVMAATSRVKALELVSDTDIPVMGGHFPYPGVMKFIRNINGSYAYTPVYGNKSGGKDE